MKDMGIGVDIELNSRFSIIDPEKDKRFLGKIFTKGELDYCYSKKYPAQSLAAVFCAKEAAIKALANIGIRSPELFDIEVTHDLSGMPKLKFKKSLKAEGKVSLSHAGRYSVAFVIIKRLRDEDP